MKSFFKKTGSVILTIVIVSIIVTIVNNKVLNTDRTFFYRFIDYVFFINLPGFIIGSLMFLTERGFFNVIIYSTNKVRSVISKHYRYTLSESEDISESEITEHLKHKYLYKNNKFTWTFPIFVGTSTIFISIIASVGFFYGFTPV